MKYFGVPLKNRQKGEKAQAMNLRDPGVSERIANPSLRLSE